MFLVTIRGRAIESREKDNWEGEECRAEDRGATSKPCQHRTRCGLAALTSLILASRREDYVRRCHIEKPGFGCMLIALFGFGTSFGSESMSNSGKTMRVLAFASLWALVAALLIRAQAQMPTAIPNGLPTWAYNIPDKDQPPLKPMTGTIHVPGSAQEYDAAQVRSTTTQ